MDLNEYPIFADKTAIYPDRGNNLVYTLTGLSGEVGEMSNILKKLIRKYNLKSGDSLGSIPPSIIQQLIDELGDVLWYVIATTYELGININIVAGYNIKKLEERVNRGEIVDHP